MIYGIQNGEDFVKPAGAVTVDWGNAITAGLVGYWPFTEGSGLRWRNVVTQKHSVLSSGSYPGRWLTASPGYAIDVLEADSTGPNIQIDNPIGGLSRATIGCMSIVRVSKAGVAGATLKNPSNAPQLKISSDGAIDNHCRVDFIANTAYARPSAGQLTADTIYSIFATWVSGAQPNVYKAAWPNGLVTEFAYNDRGSASGTIPTANCYVGLDGNIIGRVSLIWLGMWNRVIGTEEMQSLSNYPWQMIYEQERSYVAASLAASTVFRRTFGDTGRTGSRGLQ